RDGGRSGRPDAADWAGTDGVQHGADRHRGGQAGRPRTADRRCPAWRPPVTPGERALRSREGAGRFPGAAEEHPVNRRIGEPVNENHTTGKIRLAGGVDPRSERDMTRVEKPWGYELHWAKTDRYVGKLIHVNAG